MSVSLRPSASSFTWTVYPTQRTIIMSYEWDNIENKYNAVSHLYFSEHIFVFSHIVLMVVCRIFRCCSNCNRCLLCAAVVVESCLLSSEKMNEPLSDVILLCLILTSWIGWKQWNSQIKCLQYIQTYFHHTIQIELFVQKLIQLFQYNHAGIICHDILLCV